MVKHSYDSTPSHRSSGDVELPKGLKEHEVPEAVRILTELDAQGSQGLRHGDRMPVTVHDLPLLRVLQKNGFDNIQICKHGPFEWLETSNGVALTPKPTYDPKTHELLVPGYQEVETLVMNSADGLVNLPVVLSGAAKSILVFVPDSQKLEIGPDSHQDYLYDSDLNLIIGKIGQSLYIIDPQTGARAHSQGYQYFSESDGQIYGHSGELGKFASVQGAALEFSREYRAALSNVEAYLDRTPPKVLQIEGEPWAFDLSAVARNGS